MAKVKKVKIELLSIGMNSKLGKRVGVFNLPQLVTCPGFTEYCKSVCYAGKAERLYKNAKAKRQRNYIATQQADFVTKIVTEIQDSKIKLVRWFESGDAYDQVFLEKVFEVCKLTPTVKYLMYTKSFMLDWKNMPANLQVYWSVDHTTTRTIPAGLTARIREKNSPLVSGEVTCVPQGATKHYCGTLCHTCWNGASKVYFDKH